MVPTNSHHRLTWRRKSMQFLLYCSLPPMLAFTRNGLIVPKDFLSKSALQLKDLDPVMMAEYKTQEAGNARRMSRLFALHLCTVCSLSVAIIDLTLSVIVCHNNSTWLTLSHAIAISFVSFVSHYIVLSSRFGYSLVTIAQVYCNVWHRTVSHCIGFVL